MTTSPTVPNPAAVERAISLFKAAAGDVAHGATLDDLRARDDAMWAQFLADDAIVDPVDAGGVPAYWVSVEGADPDRVLVWLHGGGFQVGTAAGRQAFGAEVSRVSGCRVLLPDFRLAPEHLFPAQLDDSLTVYRWLVDRVEPDRVVVGGDSAGGGLALSLLVAGRDRGLPSLAGGVPVSASTDWTLSSPSHTANAHLEPVVTPDVYRTVRTTFLGGEGDFADPALSPLFAELAGLPPLLVMVGADETLLDDSVRFADAARQAGVEVDLRVYPGMFHYWHLFSSFLDEGQRAVEAIAGFVNARTIRASA